MLQRCLPGIVGVFVALGCYWMGAPPKLDPEKANEVAAQFAFVSEPLPEISGEELRKIRKFHPTVDHMAGWLSFVGAGVSIGDLDGNGLSDDLVYVDSRTDEVTVAPAPTTSARFEPFLLKPQSLPYVDKWTAPMGSVIGDYNEDGWQDILVYFWARSPVIYLRTPPQGEQDTPLSRIAFQETDLVTPHQNWHTNAVTTADIDGDGHIDLLVGNYNPDGSRMLEFDGGDIERETLMASFGRATNGGVTRIFLSNGKASSSSQALFRETPDVLTPEVAGGWVFGAGAADLNGDLLPEIYLVHDWGPDRLLVNRSEPGNVKLDVVTGKRSITTPRSLAVGMDTFNGMGVDFVDLNRDGFMDFAVSNITCDYAFHQSTLVFEHTTETEKFDQGIAPFECKSESYGLSRGGWAWDVKFADFNNSGRVQMMQATGFMPGEIDRWPELQEFALSNEELARFPEVYPKLDETAGAAALEHNPFFVYVDDRYFDIAPYMSDRIGDITNGRGFAIADVDWDGQLDFARANNWGQSRFFRNESPNVGVFVGLNLRMVLSDEIPEALRSMMTDTNTIEGEGYTLVISTKPPTTDIPSRPAVGAVVKLTVGQGEEQVVRAAQVDGGNGHSGQRAPELHFGLGEVPSGTDIQAEIAWRDRTGAKQQAKIAPIAAQWHTVYLITRNEKNENQ